MLKPCANLVSLSVGCSAGNELADCSGLIVIKLAALYWPSWVALNILNWACFPPFRLKDKWKTILHMGGIALKLFAKEKHFYRCQDGRVVKGARLKIIRWLSDINGGRIWVFWSPSGGVGSNPTLGIIWILSHQKTAILSSSDAHLFVFTGASSWCNSSFTNI